MSSQNKVEALHRRLSGERERLVRLMAEADAMPASGAILQLASLDGAIAAVEALMKAAPVQREDQAAAEAA